MRLMRVCCQQWVPSGRTLGGYRPVIAARKTGNADFGVSQFNNLWLYILQRLFKPSYLRNICCRQVQDMITKIIHAMGGHKPTKHELFGPAFVLKPRGKTVPRSNVVHSELTRLGTCMQELWRHFIKGSNIRVKSVQISAGNPVTRTGRPRREITMHVKRLVHGVLSNKALAQ